MKKPFIRISAFILLATLSSIVGKAIAAGPISYTDKLTVSGNTISVSWPESFTHGNYFLYVRAWTEETINGKTIQVQNGIYDFSKTTSGFSLKLKNPSGFLSYYAVDTINGSTGTSNNYSVQALTGTTPSLDGTNGVNAILTLTGNTTIILSNLVAGQTGNLTITNASTAYTLSLSGYNILIAPYLTFTGDTITMSGNNLVDVLSWYYDGTNVIINGTLGYN